jgi:RHS repeat-associated protein
MTYDANGNTLADGMNSYVWDARNRLVSADNNGASFSYDPLGRRVSKTVLSTTTNFLYDGANAVQEFGTLPTANLLTGAMDERFTRTSATETDHYLTDALGSTVALTDAAGNSVAQYSYAPFGSLSASGATTSNSYTYTGRESDGLGINYYRARYYNPATGRFLSEDPIGFMGGINKYAYVGDSPLGFIDSSGMDSTGSAALDDFFDFVGGAWSVASFGLSDKINAKLGFPDLYNRCNSWYKAGEVAGAIAPVLVGGGEGLAQDLGKSAGDEWSHWIPARAAQSRGGLIPDLIVDSNLNGQYVSALEHALNDNYRMLKGMTLADKNPVWLQQMNRIPSWVLGASAGAAYSGASLTVRSQ